jgi:hypothetical protein
MKYIITESQYKTALMESLPSYIRRRLNFDNVKEDIDSILEYHVFACESNDAGEFVSEICDWLTNQYLEDLTVTPKDKDGLYYFFVDLLSDYLVNIHKKKCS